MLPSSSFMQLVSFMGHGGPDEFQDKRCVDAGQLNLISVVIEQCVFSKSVILPGSVLAVVVVVVVVVAVVVLAVDADVVVYVVAAVVVVVVVKVVKPKIMLM